MPPIGTHVQWIDPATGFPHAAQVKRNADGVLGLVVWKQDAMQPVVLDNVPLSDVVVLR